MVSVLPGIGYAWDGRRVLAVHERRLEGNISVIQAGQVVLFTFPQTDQVSGKMRPALVLRRCPGPHEDWLICMISAQLRHELAGIDEIIRPTDGDFAQTGLKSASVIRATRLAVVVSEVLQGKIGALGAERLSRLRQHIADWISGSD